MEIPQKYFFIFQEPPPMKMFTGQKTKRLFLRTEFTPALPTAEQIFPYYFEVNFYTWKFSTLF